MKTTITSILAMVLAMVSVSVFAADETNANATSTANAQQSQSAYTSDYNSNGQGQGQYFEDSSNSNNRSTVTGSDLSRMVPAVSAPALTTTLTETCMGSTSVGVGWSGAGFSFGTTWRDSACVRRLDARQIASIHPNFAIAAKELMCDSDAVFEAFKRAGLPCAPRDGYEVAVAEPKK